MSRRLALAVLVASAALAALPTASTAIVYSLQTFPVSVDVKLDIKERSIWKGIREGCFAPAENFDMNYELKIDSTPGKDAKLKNGTATLTSSIYGATPSYGDRGSFRQFSSSAPWELVTRQPPSCGASAAVPSWATSPTCKRVSERVSASLLRSAEGKEGDGSVVIARTPKAAPTVKGASIGPSCARTLHELALPGLDSELGIGLTTTAIQVPIPKLEDKLRELGEGSATARPSFRVAIRIGGDCTSVSIRPTVGQRDGFRKAPYSQPRNALGSFNGDAQQTPCMVSGSGTVTVRREGKVKGTRFSIPKAP